LDFATIVSGSVVNYFGAGVVSPNGGIVGLTLPVSTESPRNAKFYRTLVSGDISGGNVLVRMYYRTTSAVNRTITGSTEQPVTLFIENLGPVTT